jgi:hypothetical protein
VAQYPVLLPRTAVTLTNADATQTTFVALVVVAIAVVILVVPSFALLFSLQGRACSAEVSMEHRRPSARAAKRDCRRQRILGRYPPKPPS